MRLSSKLVRVVTKGGSNLLNQKTLFSRGHVRSQGQLKALDIFHKIYGHQTVKGGGLGHPAEVILPPHSNSHIILQPRKRLMNITLRNAYKRPPLLILENY